MPTIRVLPHLLCADGLSFDTPAGALLVDALLAHGVAMEHACEKVCACATCHVHVRQGQQSLAGARQIEEDQLDMAWGVDADSRLACQVRVGQGDLVIELPRHSRNHAGERAG